MTVDVCAQFCLAAGYSMFGIEYSRECFCGAELQPGSVSAPEEDCNMPCGGDAMANCGGPSRLSVYLWP